MKKYLFATLSFGFLFIHSVKSQTIDTLVDVGGYRLHFHIIKGNGTPILFEGGSGADVSVWDGFLTPISNVTHATLITYDRAGFGKSELDTSTPDIDKHGILRGVEGLEKGLQKLGYDKNIMLVGHSFGGFYATLYAARHPSTVKAAVLIDANHVCWFTDEYVKTQMEERIRDSAKTRSQSLAYYYQSLNLGNIVGLLKKSPFPATVPVIDLVADNVPPFPDSAGAARWKACHRQFADAQPNRVGIVALGCAHFIFRDNPLLALSAVVKAYGETVGKEERAEILGRFLDYNIEALNKKK